MQVTFFARNIDKIAHFQREVAFFVWFFFLRVFFQSFLFHGNRNSTEKMFFFATTVKLNSQNNRIKSFPFCRYKEKQVSLIAASRKNSIFCSQKNPNKYKALFPQWNLKTCKFYDVSNTEAQFDFRRKFVPVAHNF